MTRSLPAFPGAVGLSFLHVYPWDSADGEHGGSAHVHLACTECYVTVSGRGRLQTLDRQGFVETELAEGTVAWFTPGTIHRAVNDGDLKVLVVMQNSGLPEAGDAVLTFPDPYLRDEDTYQQAATLAGPGGPSARLARTRRDLSLTGFAALVDAVRAGDVTALERFYARAGDLVRSRMGGWRQRVVDGPLAAAQHTLATLDALAQGDLSYLDGAAVSRIEPSATRTFGMCGMLDAYDAIRAAAAG